MDELDLFNWEEITKRVILGVAPMLRNRRGTAQDAVDLAQEAIKRYLARTRRFAYVDRALAACLVETAWGIISDGRPPDIQGIGGQPPISIPPVDDGPETEAERIRVFFKGYNANRDAAQPEARKLKDELDYAIVKDILDSKDWTPAKVAPNDEIRRLARQIMPDGPLLGQQETERQRETLVIYNAIKRVGRKLIEFDPKYLEARPKGTTNE
jgi:hypothetical protein